MDMVCGFTDLSMLVFLGMSISLSSIAGITMISMKHELTTNSVVILAPRGHPCRLLSRRADLRILFWEVIKALMES